MDPHGIVGIPSARRPPLHSSCSTAQTAHTGSFLLFTIVLEEIGDSRSVKHYVIVITNFILIFLAGRLSVLSPGEK